jgi:FMN-dependent NADH-azoreductase
VTVAGRTFKFAAPGVAKGLLFGKKAFVIEARGGDYTDLPVNAFDFQEPLLRVLLMFLGIFDVSFIRAEGMRQRVDEMADIVRNAEAVIARLAA